ncbi:alpha/beta fold hydrolase [Saliphagus infecundisoli]|uniref:Alpha/beta fold hydrolase n=1 Tax=Saliphagus infecundisoli TaxID=1849069 RepID=A0ABD5QCW0_9EURY|nr:alpha/beta hydrolase [Saliphagus infecundisoli]
MRRASITEDTSLAYRDLGQGDPVILLHGGCMNHRVWESQICALLDSGYRVIAPDLRGHGRSDAPDSSYTVEMYAEDLATLSDALRIDDFALVGWSLGATIAATFAKDYRDRLTKLVLVSSSIFSDISQVESGKQRESELPLGKMIDNQRRNRPRGMERFVAGMFGSKGHEQAIEWLWSIGMQTPMWVAVRTLEIYRDPAANRLHEGLNALDIPVAIFHGALDGSATLDEARIIVDEILTDGHFVPFHESGHVPFLEESERFDEALVSFLED